jgi:hypothetical protein
MRLEADEEEKRKSVGTDGMARCFILYGRGVGVAALNVSRPGAGVFKRKQLCWVCNVRLKREEEGAGSSRTKIQGVVLS